MGGLSARRGEEREHPARGVYRGAADGGGVTFAATRLEVQPEAIALKARHAPQLKMKIGSVR